MTDAGSVKAAIYESLGGEFLGMDAQHRFVGSHPIAGSEQSGFESADANLFLNRLCVVTIQTTSTTTPEEANSANVNRVVSFWKSLGSTVHLMSPDEHDRILALTSHLPHILSSVTAACVEPELLSFTGTGYRDTTRIAAGSASLWASILLGNAKHCVESILIAEDHLRNFRNALVAGNSDVLEALWNPPPADVGNWIKNGHSPPLTQRYHRSPTVSSTHPNKLSIKHRVETSFLKPGSRVTPGQCR